MSRKRYINYGKKVTITRNPYKVKYAKTGGAMALQKAGQALSVARSVYGLLNTEFKSKDVYDSGTSISSTASFSLLNGMAKGDTISTRTARSILCKSLELNLTFIQHASATETLIRAIVFIDKSPEGTAPTVAQLLDASGYTHVAQRNLNYRKEFVILKDFRFHLSSNNQEVVTKQFYKKLNMHTIFDDSDAGTIADIMNNALYIMWWSNEATNTPTFYMQSRVRFLDN